MQVPYEERHLLEMHGELFRDYAYEKSSGKLQSIGAASSAGLARVYLRPFPAIRLAAKGKVPHG